MTSLLRERMAELLESVINGESSPSDAVATADSFPPEAWDDRLVNSAFHRLVHYREDEGHSIKQ